MIPAIKTITENASVLYYRVKRSKFIDKIERKIESMKLGSITPLLKEKKQPPLEPEPNFQLKRYSNRLHNALNEYDSPEHLYSYVANTIKIIYSLREDELLKNSNLLKEISETVENMDSIINKDAINRCEWDYYVVVLRYIVSVIDSYEETLMLAEEVKNISPLSEDKFKCQIQQTNVEKITSFILQQENVTEMAVFARRKFSYFPFLMERQLFPYTRYATVKFLVEYVLYGNGCIITRVYNGESPDDIYGFYSGNNYYKLMTPEELKGAAENNASSFIPYGSAYDFEINYKPQSDGTFAFNNLDEDAPEFIYKTAPIYVCH